MKVMIFTFSNTTKWWRHIAENLAFASSTVLISDLPDADVDISPTFHRHMRTAAPKDAIDALGADACGDVIARCRLLRVLHRDKALRMIGAMWRTINELLDAERPDLFLCFLIDRYILDLFDRALRARGVRYVGIAIGVLPETIMFMSRGEYVPVREPASGEVERAVETLVQPDFVPSYVPERRFGTAQFLRKYAHFTARWLAFEALRVTRRRPYDYRYLATRSPRSGFRVRLKDRGVSRFVDHGWRRVFDATPVERRVFVALSVNPEAAIEYWVQDLSLVDYVAVLDRVGETLGRAGYRMFVKDHPSQFAFRHIELVQELAARSTVTFLPYDVSGQWLVANCGATFTWTGTVGLQAAFAGARAIVEANAYYVVDGLFVTFGRIDDVDAIPARLAEFRPAEPIDKRRRVLARHLLRAAVPGDYMSWRGFTATDSEHVARAASLLVSLNTYLPAMAR